MIGAPHLGLSEVQRGRQPSSLTAGQITLQIKGWLQLENLEDRESRQIKYGQHSYRVHTYLTSRENCPSFLLLPLLIVIITRVIVLVIVILALADSDQVLFVLVGGRATANPGSLETQEGMSVVVETGETGESLDQGLLHQGPDRETVSDQSDIERLIDISYIRNISWGQIKVETSRVDVTCCQRAERAGWDYTDWRGEESRAGSGWSPLPHPSCWPAASQSSLRPLVFSLALPPPRPQDPPPCPPVSPGRSQTEYFEWKIWENFSCVGWVRSCLHLLHSPPGRETARERSWQRQRLILFLREVFDL